MRNAYLSSVIPKGNGPLGRPKYRWKDNIKLILLLRGVETEDVDCIKLA
jgi:hypothetical protein